MKAILLSILLVFSGAVFAQDPVISLNITTRDDDTGKKLDGATVIVKSGGSVFVTKTSASNGKVPTIDLPLGQNYTIYIQKTGYVTKVATINGNYDYPEDLPPFIPFAMESSLFARVEGVDFGWLETTPMVKFELDQYGNQTWDQAALKEMLKKIEALKEELAKKLAEEAQKKKDFDAFVAAGDKANTAADYQTAVDNYDKALALFDEAPVKKKRDDAQKALEEQNKAAETEKKFQEKMNQAKDAYTAKNYESALALYKEASTIKPTEQLPKDRITEIEKLLKDQADQDAKFKKFVADGDAAVGTEDFDKAITNYESAIGIKEDAAVKAKLEEAKKKKADKLAADQASKELDAKYDKLIADADKAFDSKTYEDARSKYDEALKLKPKESHPAARISEIDGILKKLKEDEDAAKKLEEDYKKFIQDGDAAFTAKNWDGAITKYQEALKIKPAEKHPTDQIKLAEENKKKDADKKALDENYTKLLADGKSLADAKKYKEAIDKYKEASGLKPDEAEPKNRITELEKLIADLANAQEKEEKYKGLMAEGQTLQNGNQLEDALKKYEDALYVKSGDAEAQKKIDEVKKLIADKKSAEEQEAKFKELVASGEKNFTSQLYEEAKSQYQKALAIKDDQGVKDKIKEIDEVLKKNADQAMIQAKYDAAVKQADDAFAAKDWQKALEKYKEALTFKDEEHPKTRIATITEKLAAEASAQEQEKKFNDLVSEGDNLGGQKEYDAAIKKYEEAIKLKADAKVSQKIVDLKAQQKEDANNQALITQYKAKVAEADAAFDKQDWDAAKKLYADAIDIKSDEDYPKKQLTEIERLMKLESVNEVEEQYQRIIEKANELRDKESFEEAISYYERAKNLKSSDPYPTEQIKQIQETIKQREAEQANKEAFDKKYYDLLAAGDKALGTKDYTAALAKYKEALDMKPSETVPKEKIKQVNDLLEQLDAQAALDAKYKASIDRADKFFKDGNYNEAKSAYQDALSLKSTEQYPKDQMVACDKKLQEQSQNQADVEYQKVLDAANTKFEADDYAGALEQYKKAKDMKPSETFPQKRIDEINKMLADAEAKKALNEKYDAAIRKADDLFRNDDYKSAKTAYQDALDIRSGEAYPVSQIALCDERMKLQTVDEVEEQYNKIIEAAQKKFDEKNYEGAIDYYKRAKGIRPSDPYPQERIDAITKIMADQKALEELDAKYKAAVDKADALFNNSEYKSAKSAYKDALSIKSGQQYPMDQILLCDKQMQSQSKDEEEAQYQKLLTAAQKKFDEKDYEGAIDYYKRAKTIRPSDPIPQQRIDEINQIMKDLLAENEKRSRYTMLIQEADNHYERQEWKQAMNNYMDALDLFKEQYPEDQLEKCRKALEDIPDADEAYRKLIEKADEYFEGQNYDKAKSYYQRALTIKPSDQHPKRRLKEIEDILNPPQDIVAKSKDLTDYGNRVNETPLDIEAMLVEAKEQAREFEIQRIYQQREDAADSLRNWTIVGENMTFTGKERADEIEEDITVVQLIGDNKRLETTEEVESWQTDLIEHKEEMQTTQENDIQFQNKKVEAMQLDIEENQFDNDEQREQYLVDVEKIKIEVVDKTREEALEHEDLVMDGKEYITEMEESFEVNDANNEVKRQNVLVDIEDMNVILINKHNEDSWNQEDQVMHTKDQSNNIEEDIIANNLESDNNREDYVVIVENQQVNYENSQKKISDNQLDETMKSKAYEEEMVTEISENILEKDDKRVQHLEVVEAQQVSYEDREKKDANDQLNDLMDTKAKEENIITEISENNLEKDEKRVDHLTVVEGQVISYEDRDRKNSEHQINETSGANNEVEQMQIAIEENNADNDLPRQEVVLIVEDKHVEFEEATQKLQNDQTDAILQSDDRNEKMELDIEDHNREMGEDREGYEKVVTNIKEEISDENKQMSEENSDNGFVTKDQTEDIVNEQTDNNNKMDKDAERKADKNIEAIEEYEEIINDVIEKNDEGLVNAEQEIEGQKDIVNTENDGIVVENELGQKYPEGVTEETFTINDSRGLLKAYVVRRIVVINGTGVVYEKTQTRYGAVTYTRDGQPISEYQWSDETSSAGLTRN